MWAGTVCERDLQQPIASPVECWHDGGMDVAAVQALKVEATVRADQ